MVYTDIGEKIRRIVAPPYTNIAFPPSFMSKAEDSLGIVACNAEGQLMVAFMDKFTLQSRVCTLSYGLLKTL